MWKVTKTLIWQQWNSDVSYCKVKPGLFYSFVHWSSVNWCRGKKVLTVEEPKTKVCVVLSCGVDRLSALVELSIPSRRRGKRLRDVANGFAIMGNDVFVHSLGDGSVGVVQAQSGPARLWAWRGQTQKTMGDGSIWGRQSSCRKDYSEHEWQAQISPHHPAALSKMSHISSVDGLSRDLSGL